MYKVVYSGKLDSAWCFQRDVNTEEELHEAIADYQKHYFIEGCEPTEIGKSFLFYKSGKYSAIIIWSEF